MEHGDLGVASSADIFHIDRDRKKDNSPGDATSLPTFTTILPSLEVFKDSTVIGNRSMICKSKVEVTYMSDLHCGIFYLLNIYSHVGVA